MTRAVLIPVGESSPELVDIPDGDDAAYQYLASAFPDAFDAIRLGRDVEGYVSDVGLLDGSRWNSAGQALVDSVYLATASRTYHLPVAGPMVVLGVTRGGAATSVPDKFLTEFLPALATEATS